MKKYTKLEIELYEKLMKISFTYENFSSVFRESMKNSKNEKLLKRTFFEYAVLDMLIKEIKWQIPKKFLILNELGNKDGN